MKIRPLVFPKFYEDKLEPMNRHIALDEEELKYREMILDQEMLRSPEGVANQVKHHLLEQVRETAPWLLDQIEL